MGILVNDTGGPPPTPVSGQDPAIWAKHFNAMVLSVVAITDRVLPGMRAAGWGRIITSTSSGMITPIPNLSLSNALRSTLLGWSKTLAREVGRDGITANIILPGRIATLASARASYITGSVIRVDGGLGAARGATAGHTRRRAGAAQADQRPPEHHRGAGARCVVGARLLMAVAVQAFHARSPSSGTVFTTSPCQPRERLISAAAARTSPDSTSIRSGCM